MQSTSGCVFGGYTDANWNSRFKRGKFTASQSSCLFTIVNPSQTPPTRYLIKQPSYAINNHPRYVWACVWCVVWACTASEGALTAHNVTISERKYAFYSSKGGRPIK